ncbi:reverse transcriptase [Plakobranchus ocellatus]|uniref:Reverse transcriptase n=1 Tax=Plakobranchus ocellatus TaxID=259542 RepID=A0AAV3YMT3_9GAST|nr:reverse transcriptase [Plakobranchus ocellatus]
MIQQTLRMHYIPDDMQVRLGNYFNGFKLRFSTLEVGIVMGCTISPILFVLAMEVILGATEETTTSSPRQWMLHTASEGFHGRHYDPVFQGKGVPQNTGSARCSNEL